MCKACVHENQFIKTKFRRGFGEERVWAQRWVSDEKKKIGSERVRGECRRIERTPLLCTILHVYYYFISDSKTIQFSHNLRDDCFVHRCTCKTLIVDAIGCASLALIRWNQLAVKYVFTNIGSKRSYRFMWVKGDGIWHERKLELLQYTFLKQ